MNGYEIIQKRVQELEEQRLVRVSHSKRNGKVTHSLIRLEKEEGLNEIKIYCIKVGLKYTNHEVAVIKTSSYERENGDRMLALWEQIDRHIGRQYEFIMEKNDLGEHILNEIFDRDLRIEK
ncbi:MAG: hypothetical protein ACRCZ1_06365 [Cetobacterium sp.]